MIRTHNCIELRTEHIGEEVVLAGWINTIRDHGGVLFIDLRDHYGVTQIVIHDDSLLADVTKETVISAKGVVKKRDEDTLNTKIETG